MRLRGAIAAAVLAVVAVLVVPAGASTGVSVTTTVVTGSGLGFDACQAPSTSMLRAWTSSPYRAVNIYFGGSQRACPSQPNLTSDWVTTVVSNGWSLIPTYVGLQAPTPCYSKSKASTTAATATSDGVAAATDAIHALQALGLDKTIAYLDLEPFDVSKSSTCAATVIAYTDAWTQTLHASGFSSGVYVNLSFGASTFINAYSTDAHHPDDIWFARYDNNATTSGYVPSGMWPNHQLHQYASGSTAETYGNESITVDRDAIGGDVVSASSVTTPSSSPYTYYVSGTPTNNLNERTSPTSAPGNANIAATAKNGDPLNIVCQAAGEIFDGDQVWDRLDNDNYVTDIYTTTTGRNGFSSAIPRCDATRPTASLKPLPTAVVSAAVSVSWQASDPANADGSPSGVYDSAVRVQWAPWNGGFGGWHAVVTSTQGRSASWRVTAGYTYCFEVQARDLSGNASSWSAPACTARALDDLSLARGTGWTRARNTHFYEGTYTQATSTSRSLTRAGAVASRLALVATTCSRCGAVRVSIAGHLVATVNLYSATTHWQHVIALPAFALRSGTVVVTTTSSNLVQVDGLAIGRV